MTKWMPTAVGHLYLEAPGLSSKHHSDVILLTLQLLPLLIKHQNKSDFKPSVESHAHFILNVEETCYAFSFHKSSGLAEIVMSVFSNCSVESFWQKLQSDKRSLGALGFLIEEHMENDPAHGDRMTVCLIHRLLTILERTSLDFLI